MTDRFEMRAGDTDRDRIAEILRDAHGEGRLTHDELMARLDATYEARTYRDLDVQIADLPLPRRPAVGANGASAERPASALRASARRAGTRMARATLTAAWWIYGCVVAINVVVWLLVSIGQGDPAYPWPLWVAGPWGVVLTCAEAGYRSRANG